MRQKPIKPPRIRKNNPAAIYLSTLKLSGRVAQRNALNQIASQLSKRTTKCHEYPWWNLKYEDVIEIISRMNESNYAPATVNRYLCALKRVMQECWRLELISHNDYLRVNDISSITNHPKPKGRSLTKSEIHKLLVVCKDDKRNPIAGCRDAAIISLMYGAALRRQEVVDLKMSNINLQNKSMTILGKGTKYRTGFLQDFCLARLKDWITIRGKQSGPVFVRVLRSGKIEFHQLHSQTIYMALKKRQDQAGIAPFTPHDLRRTCITHLLESGVDIATVARLVGHAKIETTMRYDRRTLDIAQQAAMRLSLD